MTLHVEHESRSWIHAFNLNISLSSLYPGALKAISDLRGAAEPPTAEPPAEESPALDDEIDEIDEAEDLICRRPCVASGAATGQQSPLAAADATVGVDVQPSEATRQATLGLCNGYVTAV